MKNRGFLFIILIAVLLICPLAATGGAKVPDKNGNEVTKTNIQDDGDSILVLSSSTKKINEIDMFEYVVGAVAVEMPPTYHSQALRAQAAVCYTYAVKKRSSPDPALGGADITDDSAVHQGYLDAAARKEKWGDKYETYEKKIEEAVKDVFGKTITYDGEIITAAFHAISCGQTFSAEEVWGKDVPYLKSVTSAGDKLSPDYSSTLTLSADEFKKLSPALARSSAATQKVDRRNQKDGQRIYFLRRDRRKRIHGRAGTRKAGTPQRLLRDKMHGRRVQNYRSRLRPRGRHEPIRRGLHGAARLRLAGDNQALLHGSGDKIKIGASPKEKAPKSINFSSARYCRYKIFCS